MVGGGRREIQRKENTPIKSEELVVIIRMIKINSNNERIKKSPTVHRVFCDSRMGRGSLYIYKYEQYGTWHFYFYSTIVTYLFLFFFFSSMWNVERDGGAREMEGWAWSGYTDIQQ